MKIIKWVFLTVILSVPALGQSNGVYNANTYAYTTQVTQGNASTGSSFILANPTAFAQGMPFLPYNINASITINRNAANAETVTPTTLANCFPNSLTCTISLNFNFKHIAGESIQSGTFGLQEALNIAVASGSGTVLIDASWQGPSGTSLILAAKGASTVMIQDNRNPSGATFYQWNGSAYVATGGGGGAVSSVFGRTGGVVAVTGDYTCAQVTGCNSATGITSINGDTTAAQHIAGTGGIVCTTASGTTTCNYAGSAGSGVVATAAAQQMTCYLTAGTTVSGCPQVFTINPTATASQITTFLSGLSSPATVIVPAGTPPGFTPNFNMTMISGQAGAALFSVLANGLPCDERGVTISFASGTSTATSSGAFVPTDTGRTVVAAGTFGGTQYVFTPTMTYVNASTVTLSTNAPFTQSSLPDPVGTMATTYFQAILNQTGSSFPVQLPAGCTILTDTLAWNNSQRIIGQSPEATQILGVDGHDVIQQPDASGQGSASIAGTGIEHVNVGLGGRVDAARASVTFVNAAGTVTVQQPLYRPDHYLTSDTSNPLASGWCQGTCQNGVASTTASSTTICVPTSYFSRLTAAAGNKIMFRDFPAIYVGTVNNLSASGCAGGFSGATISPALPSGSQYTNAQIEWVQSTVGFQAITSSIASGTVTYPFTVTFSSSIAPTPASISNFPTHGRFKTANGEEYQYIGVSYSAGTAVVRTGPTTSAGQTGPFVVAPENPCPAKYEQPWPVQPTINSGDSTPSGANYFPSHCIGNAGISFPQANGNVFSGPGLTKGLINDIVFGVNDPPNAGTLNQNSVTGMYFAGDAGPFDSEIEFILMNGPEYGFVIAPSSAGMHGVAVHSVESVNNHFHDLTIHAGYPISITNSSLFHLSDVDAYSTSYDPYTGAQIGVAESLFLTYSLDEQTGAFVTSTEGCNVSNFNAEPEGGNNEEVPTYFESECFTGLFQDNFFEGIPAVIGGKQQIFTGGQFSASQPAPILNYGVQNVIQDTEGTTQGPITTTYGTCSYCDWGQYNRARVYSAAGSGPPISPGVGNRNSYDGDDSTYAIMGNYALPSPTNILSGFISNDEMASTGLTKTIDPTAPKGSYTSCSVNTGSECSVSSFNGFNGGILIGPYDRIQPIPQELSLWMRAASGTVSFQLLVQALNPSAGTCSSPGTIMNPIVTINSTWTGYSYLLNLTPYAGCDIGFGIGPTSSGSGVVEISSPSFMPTPGLVHVPTTSYTSGATCPTSAVNGDMLSFDGTHINFCFGGVVVQK